MGRLVCSWLWPCSPAPSRRRRARPLFGRAGDVVWARTQITGRRPTGWVPLRTGTAPSPQEGGHPRWPPPACWPSWRTRRTAPRSPPTPITGGHAGWIIAGTGADRHDPPVGVRPGHPARDGPGRPPGELATCRRADGWRPKLPFAFGIEQAVRALGARFNAPDGSDAWETWPRTPMRRLNLAVQAYALATQLLAEREPRTLVHTRCRQVRRCSKAVLGMALQYAGAPYVWAGEWPTTASPYGLPRPPADSTARGLSGGS